MIRHTPRSKRTDTTVPYTTLCRSEAAAPLFAADSSHSATSKLPSWSCCEATNSSWHSGEYFGYIDSCYGVLIHHPEVAPTLCGRIPGSTCQGQHEEKIGRAHV